MKVLGIGNAIVDVICKIDDDFLSNNGLTKSTMKLVDENEFKKLIDKIDLPIQGGLDPSILLTNKENLNQKVNMYMEIFRDHPYVFNLGHGIMPDTKIEMVEELVKIVRDFK